MTRADWVVVTAAVALLGWLYAAFWHSSAPGDEVRILVGGKEVQRLSLHQDRHIEVDGAIGPTTLEIHDGQARFVSAPCTGKQCIHAGWLSHGGEFAACLPNRVSLYVVSAETRFDTVNF